MSPALQQRPHFRQYNDIDFGSDELSNELVMPRRVPLPTISIVMVLPSIQPSSRSAVECFNRPL